MTTRRDMARLGYRQKTGTALVLSLARAMIRNQLVRLGVASPLRAILHKRERGGHAWSERDLESTLRHIEGQYALISAHLWPDLEGRAGMEIGPGDHLGLATCFALRGAGMYAVEKYASVDGDYTRRLVAPLRAFLEAQVPRLSEGHDVEMEVASIEECRPAVPMDFIFSVDVLEHVASPHAAFKRCHELLRPGGRMVHSIDLAGHQIGDVAHLCCPDWLWRLVYSHVETTNRVRWHEFVAAAQDAGFKEVSVRPLRFADLSSLRSRVLERWRDLPEHELGALQILLVGEK